MPFGQRPHHKTTLIIRGDLISLFTSKNLTNIQDPALSKPVWVLSYDKDRFAGRNIHDNKALGSLEKISLRKI